MATIPDWKLQLLARRRQEEAAVRGREKAEQERLSQMPAWKRGLLERRRAKLGLSPGEPSPAPGTTEAGPPDPDESAVLLEAIGPVHQNRFIRQERQQQQQQQQRSEELLTERRPGSLEAWERRLSPGEMRDQSPKGRESREERLSPREARERRLGIGGARESSPRPLEARDWRQSPGEAGDRSSRLSEVRKWRLSPGETPERSLRLAEPQEQSPRRKEVVENRLSPVESDNQKLGLTEAHKWTPDSRESQEQSWVQPEASEWRLSSGEERKDCSEECGRQEERPSPRMVPEEMTALSETLTREAPDSSSGRVEAAEQRPTPAEDGERGLRLTEGWKWTLNSGKVRDWTPRDTETQTQKPDPPESAEKHLSPLAAEAGEGEAEKEEAGAQGRPLSALQNRCSVPSPLSPEDAGTGGSRQQEEEAGELRPPPAAPLSPPPPAPPAPQSPGDPLMSRLFYGVKAGPGVGAPRRSGHTFTVNPRRSVPPAAPATPASPATADAAVAGAGKKRYPTAEEILVLGGYLRLDRSCLVKGSPERHHKQLKISFSETALETTYQYPSESSVLEELGPEPEAPSASSPPAAQPDDEEDEEELLLLQPELQGGLRTKALIVDESCRR
ncbi:phostensin isoform X2 [Pseudorca crassidens]|uniref:Protein phosphatase 1, regulatory subunit 18 n=2 Tax=Pseudorca crassidens TaxID=82174 RepID=A0A387LAA1_PSECS|nr:protein phosphatase 1, regulatory subunit 18 [Pseudorca crassidens]